MKNIIIYEDGQEINRIVADEAFARDYCQRHGYTYEVEPEPEPEPGPPPPPSLEDRVEILETETAAISAAIERGLSL